MTLDVNGLKKSCPCETVITLPFSQMVTWKKPGVRPSCEHVLQLCGV